MISKMRAPMALLLSAVLLSLASLTPSVSAQPPERFVFDTGVLKLGPNQVLRITIDWGDGIAGSVRFGRTNYIEEGCTPDGVCKLTGSNTYTGVTTLTQGEAASCDILAAGTLGRGIAVTTSQRVRVNASISDTVTGNVDAILALSLPGH